MRVPLAIAHRAGNSLAALREAVEMGVDVVECDVRTGRDRLEVRHLKSAGPLPFLWDRWELAPASAPRLGLDEVLAARSHGTAIMLDLKGDARGDMAAAVAQQLLDLPGGEVLACGRQWGVVDRLAARGRSVRPVLSARNRVELARLRRRLGAPPPGAAPAHGVSVHRSLVEPRLVAELHRAVEVVMTWPVNDVGTLDAVLAAGVSGVISDEPDVLAELLARRGPAPPAVG